MRRRFLCLLLFLATLFSLLPASGCATPPEPPPEETSTPAPAPSETPPAPTPAPTPPESKPPAIAPTPTPWSKPSILPEKLVQYADWIERNDDFTAWLTIPGTVIDYPVVYGADYIYYCDYNFDKSPSKYGAVFIDYRNTPDNPSWMHTILFAHHMRDGSMFGSLKKLKDLDFLREHPVFTYDTLYGTRRYQIFAVLIVPMLYNYYQVDFDTPADFLGFVDHMREISLFSSDLILTGRDEIITLSTCWYDFKDARFAVQAVRLPDGVDRLPATYEVNADRKTYW